MNLNEYYSTKKGGYGCYYNLWCVLGVPMFFRSPVGTTGMILSNQYIRSNRY
jgi:hypothetical protein